MTIMMMTIRTMLMMMRYLIEVIHEIEGQGGDDEEEETMIHRCKSVTSQLILKVRTKFRLVGSPNRSHLS